MKKKLETKLEKIEKHFLYIFSKNKNFTTKHTSRTCRNSAVREPVKTTFISKGKFPYIVMCCHSLTQRLSEDSTRSSEDITKNLHIGECCVVATKLEKYKEILLVSLLNDVINKMLSLKNYCSLRNKNGKLCYITLVFLSFYGLFLC